MNNFNRLAIKFSIIFNNSLWEATQIKNKIKILQMQWGKYKNKIEVICRLKNHKFFQFLKEIIIYYIIQIDWKSQTNKIQNTKMFVSDQSIQADWEIQAYKMKNRKMYAREYSKKQLQQILKICKKTPQLRYVLNHVNDRIQFYEARQRALFSQQLLAGVIKSQPKIDKQIKHKDKSLPAKTSTWFQIICQIVFTLNLILTILAGVVIFASSQENVMIGQSKIVAIAMVMVYSKIQLLNAVKKYQSLVLKSNYVIIIFQVPQQEIVQIRT